MRLTLLTLFALRLWAQPGVCFVGLNQQAEQGCPCPAGQSPCVKTYVHNINASILPAVRFLTSHQRNVIPNGVQFVTAEANWIEKDPWGCWNNVPVTCIYANYSNQLNFAQDIINKIGTEYIDWNFDYLPLLTSSEYTALTGTTCGAVFNARSCARLAWILSQYDLIFGVLANTGLKFRITPISFGTPDGGAPCGPNSCNPWLPCAIANPSTMSATTMANCLAPFEQAILARYGSSGIVTLMALHEPSGALNAATGQTFSPSDVNTALGILCPALHSIRPSTACGVAFVMLEGSYVTNIASSPPTNLAIGGIDFYFQSIASTWITQPATYAGWCSQYKIAGLRCELNESGPWGHCPNTTSAEACNGNLYQGCGWANLSLYGINDFFAWFIVQYASAMGADYVTTFNSQVFAMFQAFPQNAQVVPNACTDTGPKSYTAQVLQTIANTPSNQFNYFPLSSAGIGWKAANTWGNINITGNIATSGRVLIQ